MIGLGTDVWGEWFVCVLPKNLVLLETGIVSGLPPVLQAEPCTVPVVAARVEPKGSVTLWGWHTTSWGFLLHSHCLLLPVLPRPRSRHLWRLYRCIACMHRPDNASFSGPAQSAGRRSSPAAPGVSLGAESAAAGANVQFCAC